MNPGLVEAAADRKLFSYLVRPPSESEYPGIGIEHTDGSYRLQLLWRVRVLFPPTTSDSRGPEKCLTNENSRAEAVVGTRRTGNVRERPHCQDCGG